MSGRKQETTTGNGLSSAPILASVKGNTAGQSQLSQSVTSIASASIKPLSPQENLSLWQTACFDLRSLGGQVTILARNNRLYMIAEIPASIGKVDFVDGHVTLDGSPVVLGDTGKGEK